MTEELEILRREHREMARLLDILGRQIEMLVKAKMPDYELVESIIDYFETYPQQCHHPKEDIIFRRLMKKIPEAAAPIGELEREHEKEAEHLLKLSKVLEKVLMEVEVPREAIAQAAHEFIDNVRLHMKMEEEVFLPIAQRELSAKDWRHINRQMTDKKDPLFGDIVTERFRKFRKKIERWEAEDRSDEYLNHN